MKISVSFLKSNLSPKETIKEIGKTNADYIHVDIMDGIFVKNKNYTPGEIVNLLKDSTKPLDVHLMVKNPYKWIDHLATLKIDYLTFHYELKEDLNKIIDYVKSLGIKVGIAIKPKTSVKKIKDILPLIDLIIVMTVEPGKGGQEFMLSQIEKINTLKEIQPNYHYLIGVDGGINAENIQLINPDIIITGSFVTMSDNYQLQINKLKK